MLDLDQGCQIFLGPTYQNGEKYIKLPQNIPNSNKIYKMAIKYLQISTKYNNTAWPSKNCQKMDFWFDIMPSGNPDLDCSRDFQVRR
jgi:hypothetical protein